MFKRIDLDTKDSLCLIKKIKNGVKENIRVSDGNNNIRLFSI